MKRSGCFLALICLFTGSLAACSDDSSGPTKDLSGVKDSAVVDKGAGDTGGGEAGVDSAAADAGPAVDKGPGSDAAPVPDKSAKVDTAMKPDTGVTPDKAVLADVSPALDTGMKADSGSAGDGGATADATVSTKDGGAANCAVGETVRVEEVGTGSTDFVVLKNTGSAQASIGGYKLVMDGISTVNYSLPAGTTLAAGAKVYIFEYSTGKGSNVLKTGANIPFYNGLSSNAVALYNASGALMDYVAMGDKVVGQPAGTTITLWPWPTGFNSSTQSVTRTGSTGKCPLFLAADWSAVTSTSPSP